MLNNVLYIIGLEGMIIMANTYYHSRCSDPVEDSLKTEISDKIIIGSVVLLTIIAFSAIYWYGNSIGIYVDPVTLN
jgi:hypothetical protein